MQPHPVSTPVKDNNPVPLIDKRRDAQLIKIGLSDMLAILACDDDYPEDTDTK